MATKQKAPTWRSRKTQDNILQIFKNSDEIIVFDTETTGFKHNGGDVIIQISAIKYNTSDFTEKSRLDLYINPGAPLPTKITELTGITDELLSTMPLEPDVFPKVYEFFGDAPVCGGWNTPFDKRFMEALYERNGKVFLPENVFDVLEMARDFVEKSETDNFKLGSIAHLYGADKGLTFHNSMDDTLCTARMLRIFKAMYDERAPLTSSISLLIPRIKAVNFWAGFRGFSRQYIETDIGTFYYDIRSKVWGAKKDNLYSIEEIDMEELKSRTFAFIGATTEAELARYKG